MQDFELLGGDLEADIPLEGCDNLDLDSADEVAVDIDRTVGADFGIVAVAGDTAAGGCPGDAEVALVLFATEVWNHAVKSGGPHCH